MRNLSRPPRFLRSVHRKVGQDSLAKNSALHCFCRPMDGTLAFEPRYLRGFTETKTRNTLLDVPCFRMVEITFVFLNFSRLPCLLRRVHRKVGQDSLVKNSALHCFCRPMVGTLAFEPRYLRGFTETKTRNTLLDVPCFRMVEITGLEPVTS